jgi:hypothetical protein
MVKQLGVGLVACVLALPAAAREPTASLRLFLS